MMNKVRAKKNCASLVCLLAIGVMPTIACAVDLGGILKGAIQSDQQSSKQVNNTSQNSGDDSSKSRQAVIQPTKVDADIEKAWSCSPQVFPNGALESLKRKNAFLRSRADESARSDRIYLTGNSECKISDEELAKLAFVMEEKYLLPEDQYHTRKLSDEFSIELKRRNGLKNTQEKSFEKAMGKEESEEDNANAGILYLQPVERNSTLDKAGLKRLLDTSDTLETSQMPGIASMNLGSDYSYAPMENCYTEKIKPYESQLDEDRNKRKAFIALIECKLKYFNQEQAFLKKADVEARVKIEKILSPRADEISSEEARSALIKAYKTLPKSKVLSTIHSVQSNLAMYYQNQKEFDRSKRLEPYVHSVKVLMDIAKPEDVYRESKKIILQSNQIWNPSRTIHLK